LDLRISAPLPLKKSLFENGLQLRKKFQKTFKKTKGNFHLSQYSRVLQRLLPLFSSYLSGCCVFISGIRAMTGTPG
jgi:hypothetical protein